MAEVFVRFRDPVEGPQGERFAAQACGAPNLHGLWEGWLEFVPIDGGEAIHTPRETTQPNRTDAEYWATGLTPTYLEGALARAFGRAAAEVAPRPGALFDGPADEDPGPMRRPAAPVREAILDPFSLYEKGEALLRRELGALSAWHLVNIIEAHGLSDLPESRLQAMQRPELVAEIIAGVTGPARARRS